MGRYDRRHGPPEIPHKDVALALAKEHDHQLTIIEFGRLLAQRAVIPEPDANAILWQLVDVEWDAPYLGFDAHWKLYVK